MMKTRAKEIISLLEDTWGRDPKFQRQIDKSIIPKYDDLSTVKDYTDTLKKHGWKAVRGSSSREWNHTSSPDHKISFSVHAVSSSWGHFHKENLLKNGLGHQTLDQYLQGKTEGVLSYMGKQWDYENQCPNCMSHNLNKLKNGLLLCGECGLEYDPHK